VHLHYAHLGYAAICSAKTSPPSPSGGADVAQIDHVPVAEGLQQIRHNPFRAGVVASPEHRVVGAAQQAGLDQQGRVNRVERLDHLGVGEPRLDLLAEGLDRRVPGQLGDPACPGRQRPAAR
jgi:hypothetical protein